MRDKIQTITTKESSHAEISELPLKPVEFASEYALQIVKDTNPSCLSPLKQLKNMPLLSTYSEQDLKLLKHKSTKKSSKIDRDDNAVCKREGDESLEIASETASTPVTISKRKRRQNSPEVKLEPLSKLDSDIIDTSTPKSTTRRKKKNRFSADNALSPERLTPESSKLPLLTGGFALRIKQELASALSPKRLDRSADAESSLILGASKSMLKASSNLVSPKTDVNSPYTFKKSPSSADYLPNLKFSPSSFGRRSFSWTPKTPESFQDAEMQQWKMRRGMSDIGPRSHQNLDWRDNVHGSSSSLHRSFLETPPYPRTRERLLSNPHQPRRYSLPPVGKYHSFQHKAHQAKDSEWKSSFLNRCWSLKNHFIDSHCHLDFLFDRLPFDGSFQKYYRKNLDTFPSNFAGCVAVFCEPMSFTSEGLWKVLVNDDMVWLAMGCHPKKATDFDDAAENGLRDCIRHPKIVAVGEIGLDYSGRFNESADIQKKVFVCQIKMALSVKKPLVIHCRDAQDDCLKIMKKYVPSDYRIHCHCFTKGFMQAKEWLDHFPNLYIGLTPLVTYPSAKEVHETALKLPLERLLLETDAPYFVPRFVPRGMMKFSHPGLAISVAFEVAKLKGTSVETVLKHCLENTKQMYGIKK